jgi:hypothetical protein
MSLQAKMMITLLLMGIAVLVVELLRRRKLTESYTLLWLFVVGFTAAAAWTDRFLDFLATFFGAIAPVSALTLLSLVFILVMLIYFSTKITRLGRDIKEMAQEVALRNAPPAPPPPDDETAGGRPRP